MNNVYITEAEELRENVFCATGIALNNKQLSYVMRANDRGQAVWYVLNCWEEGGRR